MNDIGPHTDSIFRWRLWLIRGFHFLAEPVNTAPAAASASAAGAVLWGVHILHSTAAAAGAGICQYRGLD